MRLPTTKQAIRHTAEYYGVPEEALTSKACRAREAVLKRQIAMYVASKTTFKSLRQLGDEFGFFDSTIVAGAIKKIAGLMQNDPEMSDDIKAIITSVTNDDV